jgi:hypothetical protein
MRRDHLSNLRVQQLSGVQPIFMATAPLSKYRLVSRNLFYGVARTDAVQVADGRKTWFGQLKLLFRFFSATGRCVNFAIISQYNTNRYLPAHKSDMSDFFVSPSSPETLQVVDTNAIDHRVIFIPDFAFSGRFFVYK